MQRILMLIKTSELIDKNIVFYLTGKKIGEIKNVFINMQKKYITGLVYEKASYFKKEKIIITIDDVENVAYQNIIIKKRIKRIEQIEGDKFLYQKGKKIISETGKDLGILEDIIFEIPGGKIKFLEISRGLLSDLIYCRKKIPIEKLMVFGKDYIITKIGSE
jgi:uncharacterized protein YrrD